MQNIKVVNKGELVFKEGEAQEKIYFIQSGRVSLYLERSGKRVEIDQLSTSHVLGESSYLSKGKHSYSVMALAPTKLLEVPTEFLVQQIEKSPSAIKLFVKSIIEVLKLTRQKLKSSKMENEEIALPQLLIPKMFSMLALIAKHLGKWSEEKKEFEVSWQALKTYTTRMFLESPQRVQLCLELLKKLGYVEITMSRDENEEEIFDKVLFREVGIIEEFADFYQFHLYKPGRSEIIYIDEMAFKIVKVLAAMAYPLPVDHRQAVSLDYEKVIEEMKKKTKLELKNTHLDLLEKKGLFVQRKSTEKGLLLQLNKEEFIKNAIFWAFLKEIDSLNTKVFVDFAFEKEVTSGASFTCSDCQSPITSEQKFCPNCGVKLQAA